MILDFWLRLSLLVCVCVCVRLRMKYQWRTVLIERILQWFFWCGVYDGALLTLITCRFQVCDHTLILNCQRPLTEIHDQAEAFYQRLDRPSKSSSSCTLTNGAFPVPSAEQRTLGGLPFTLSPPLTQQQQQLCTHAGKEHAIILREVLFWPSGSQTIVQRRTEALCAITTPWWTRSRMGIRGIFAHSASSTHPSLHPFSMPASPHLGRRGLLEVTAFLMSRNDPNNYISPMSVWIICTELSCFAIWWDLIGSWI